MVTAVVSTTDKLNAYDTQVEVLAEVQGEVSRYGVVAGKVFNGDQPATVASGSLALQLQTAKEQAEINQTELKPVIAETETVA